VADVPVTQCRQCLRTIDAEHLVSGEPEPVDFTCKRIFTYALCDVCNATIGKVYKGSRTVSPMFESIEDLSARV